MAPEIQKALPKHMDADRIARIALTEMRKNPKLLNCSQASLFGAIMTAALVGLERFWNHEQDADVVVFLYRKGYYNLEEDPEDVEFIVSKQRNGVVGTRHLRFDLQHQEFKEDWEREK